MQLVVFDIDGTLVVSDAFDAQLYIQAVREALSIDIDDDWSRYTNVTDSGVLNQILEESASRLDRSVAHAAVRETFIGLVRDYLRERGGRLPEILGAKSFVENLRARKDVAVAMATGGWSETAMMKMGAIGLDPEGLILASASDADSRVEIIRIAENRALLGRQVERRTYFGDGPWDKKACTELGYAFIAIGKNVEHTTRFSDFAAADQILAELGLAHRTAG
jgi:beta-phosphoglucomutase-like phosphatase (HAD superfamily)